MRPHEFFSIHISMSTGNATLPVSFRQPCWDFIRADSVSYIEDTISQKCIGYLVLTIKISPLKIMLETSLQTKELCGGGRFILIAEHHWLHFLRLKFRVPIFSDQSPCGNSNQLSKPSFLIFRTYVTTASSNPVSDHLRCTQICFSFINLWDSGT